MSLKRPPQPRHGSLKMPSIEAKVVVLGTQGWWIAWHRGGCTVREIVKRCGAVNSKFSIAMTLFSVPSTTVLSPYGHVRDIRPWGGGGGGGRGGFLFYRFHEERGTAPL